ncbi:MAG: hypothetical protein GDYSWBUE_001739 [Candidatus Fervidibacterota bacterium]
MLIDRVVVGPLQTNCYIVVCDVTKEAAIIDPGDEASRISAVVSYHGAAIKRIIATHGHFDHVMAVGELKGRYGAPFAVGRMERDVLKHAKPQALFFGFIASSVPEPDELLDDGQEIEVGAVKLKVISAPGHSPGHIALFVDGHLFSGDIIFESGIGRTDFPGGSHEEMMKTIRERILTLPPDTVIHPGHGNEFTLAEAKPMLSMFV